MPLFYRQRQALMVGDELESVFRRTYGKRGPFPGSAGAAQGGREKNNAGERFSACVYLWRKEWDLNPRYGITVYRISSPAHSTTLPSFRSL